MGPAIAVGVLGAVLGVVIAGLAIIVAFLTREYSEVIMRSEDGATGDFCPFGSSSGSRRQPWVAAAVALIVVD